MKCLRSLLVVLIGLVVWNSGLAKPLGDEDSNRLKAAKTAVVVLDIDKRIAYDKTTFYGVGVAQSQASATYDGFFDLEKYVGELLVRQLGDRGINGDPLKFPSELWTAELKERYADAKEDRVGETKNIEVKRILPPKWKDFLSLIGKDFLFLSVIPTLTVSTSSFDSKQAIVGMFSTMYLYDVRSGILLWSNTIGSAFNAPIDKSAKDVESNDFAPVKEVVVKLVNFSFIANRRAYKGIDVGLGLSVK